MEQAPDQETMTTDEQTVAGPAWLTKEIRQAIIQDYAMRHGGNYSAEGFYREVEADVNHRARAWFDWDTDRAALKHNLDRARAFARGLTISFSIETIHHGEVVVTTQKLPLVHSPMSTRITGGGYVITKPDDPEHMAHLCEEAGARLAEWLTKYEAPLRYAGGNVQMIQRQVRLLEKIAEKDAA